MRGVSRLLEVLLILKKKVLGVTKKQHEQFWLVLLAAGGVARSLQIALDMRLARALPAAKTPAP
jgi:hypothetical protein